MIKKILLSLALALAVATLSSGIVFAAHSVVYNSIPEPQPSSVPSLGYEATSTAEFGGQVLLDGTQRENPVVTVLMVSWACESGHWASLDCLTTPDAKFSHPVTLNIYEVGPSDTVGSLIISTTETFDMPFRPSADDTNCTGGEAGKWHDGTACNNGYAFPISFDLAGTVLPDKVIIGVAYNTSHYGSAPLGTGTLCYGTPEGCPYDSLNVGTSTTPTVGTALPTVNDVYWNTTYGPFYCDGGTGGSGTFRLDAGCWTGYLPAFKVEAELTEVASFIGGGHLLEVLADAKKKDWLDVSFGGNVTLWSDDSMTGDMQVNLHNVGEEGLDKAVFHGTEVTEMNLFDGNGETCNDAANFYMNGTFNNEPASMIFRAGDFGSPNTADTVRITIYGGENQTGGVVYDTHAPGEFHDESTCVGTARTGLDNGNLTINR